MKRKCRRNQSGSVLLAVVCMSMMCMTLATIALSVVSYTTKASSRNVQRTQAKITAEACLTEYINSFGGSYDSLKALADAYTETNPYELTVSVTGDSDFDTTYGATKLKIYSEGTGFKVVSECTFSTQTQTASIFFDAVTNNPYVPTNTLECGDGIDYSDGKANPIDGDIYLEKKKSGSDKTYLMLGSNNSEFHSHIYSEYNLYFNSGAKLLDVINKTGTLNYEPNKTSNNGNFFKQAPTLTIDGYLAFMNNVTIETTVGKTDKNMKNSDDYAGAGYSTDNLSDKDGFICVNKKIFFNMPSAINIGKYDTDKSKNRPIDVYCHGMYIGKLPKKVNGSVNADYQTIKDAYGNSSGGSDIDDGQIGSATINGNVYSYIGTGSLPYESGDLFILNSAQTVTINGDLFVEGDLYIQTSSDGGNKSKLVVNGNLHCNKNIYFVEANGDDYVIKGVGSVSGGAITVTAPAGVTVDSVYLNGMKGQVSVTSGHTIDTTFDKTDRNAYPTKGYTPSTAIDNSTRKPLNDVYKDATSNKMFSASLGGPNQDKAKYIAEKYAKALTRTLDTKKFKDSTGNIKELSHTHNNKGQVITEIYGSLRLRSSDFGGLENTGSKFYSVKLTDEDIVIALPMNKGNIVPKIRIDSTEAVDGCFVYFMYYDEGDSFDFTDTDETNNRVTCYYLDTSDTPLAEYVDGIEIYDNSSDSFRAERVTFVKTDATVRAGKTILYSAGGQKICFVSDAVLHCAYDSEETIDFTMYYTILQSILPDTVTDIDTDGEGYTNRIMYLVPDNVKVDIGDNTMLQGILYAPKSEVKLGGSSTRIFGQVKCGSYKGPNDDKVGVIRNIPPAKESILDYIGAVNNTTPATIEIQYYEY